MSARTLVTLVAIPLLVLCGCSREKSDWRSAQAADTCGVLRTIRFRTSRQLTGRRRRAAPGPARRRKGLARRGGSRYARGVPAIPDAAPGRQMGQGSPVAYRQFRCRVGGGLAVRLPSTVPVAPGEAAAVPEPPAARCRRGSGFGVQLGAFSSAERANAEWSKLKAEAPGTLDGLEPRVVVGEAVRQHHLSPAGRGARRSTGARHLRRTESREQALRPVLPA